MSYLALYRKYRPQTFREVVGQSHVVDTIQHALATGRVSHAYLFCGSRGTGKTTMAKLLAKSLNCLALQEGEPCNQCAHCVRINEGSYMDILDIDAASNRGIDEIRELREKIKLTPAEGKYKVYIIDEVHMLTAEAFNALLKTLEEPPEHAVFILATTEPHKIPMTILSRTQRYDFHRISIDDMVLRLQKVMDEMNATAEQEALRLIAKMAAGGLRDALGLLDQCITFTDETLTVERVAQIIGVAQDEFLHEWVGSMSQGLAGQALLQLQDALQQGKQSGQLLRDLIQYYRDLLVLQLGDQALDLVMAEKQQATMMKEQGAAIGRERILEIIERLAPLQNQMKYEGDGQLILEMQVIKIARLFQSKEAKQETYRLDQNQDTKDSTGIAGQDHASEMTEILSMQEKGTMEVVVPKQWDAPALWELVQQELKNQKEMTTLALIKEAIPLVENQRWILQFSKNYGFHKSNTEKPENKQKIEEILYKVCGERFQLSCTLEQEDIQKSEQASDIIKTVQKIFGEDKITIMEDE